MGPSADEPNAVSIVGVLAGTRAFHWQNGEAASSLHGSPLCVEQIDRAFSRLIGHITSCQFACQPPYQPAPSVRQPQPTCHDSKIQMVLPYVVNGYSKF